MSELDIKFIRKHYVPNSGVTINGFAYKASTDTFFCINKNGFDPFVLQEIKINPNTNIASVVKVWGPINSVLSDGTDKLKMRGKNLVSMKGLVYDEEKNGLWCSYGSFYASGQNLPFLCFVKLNDNGTIIVYGPWKVNMSIHSDKVKGMLTRSRPGYFYAFGARGSTSQDQSWGIGLVEVKEPDINLPEMSELEAKILIHWPMKTINGIYQSEFPLVPGSHSVYIKGNENCNPAIGLYSYQNNTFHNIVGGGIVLSMCKINNNMFYFGGHGNGYQWYGNQSSHNDTSPSGAYYNNNIDSQIYPGFKVVSPSFSRGTHSEETNAVWYQVDLNKLQGQQQVNYDYAGKISDFGGTDIPDSLISYIGQSYYDENKKLLYLLTYGPEILVYEVKDKIVEIPTGFSNLIVTHNINAGVTKYQQNTNIIEKIESYEQSLMTVNQIQSTYDSVDNEILDFIVWKELISD